MTIQETHIEFKILMDKADSLNSPNFTPEEIDVFLNRAEDEIIETRYTGNNNSAVTGVEETQKRVDDLKNLVVNGNITTFISNANNKPNGRFVPLPNGLTVTDSLGNVLPKYRHSLNEEATISYIDCNTTTTTNRVKVVYISHNRYNEAIRNPYEKPDKDTVFRLPYGKLTVLIPLLGSIETVELVTDSSSTLTIYHLRYLKDPQRIQYGSIYAVPTTDQMSELSDYLHKDLIEIAARIALEDIESERYKTKITEQSINTTN